MIVRITGLLESVSESGVVVSVGGLAYELMIPACAAAELAQRRGEEVTLLTVQYLEGNPAGANLIPRMIGFLSEIERDFFHEFTRVKGISMRRALRAMSVPIHGIAAAVERGDERALTALPEIGKKTAAQIIAELAGRMSRFAASAPASRPIAELPAAQRVALDILVQWGDRRVDAERWIAAAIEQEPALCEADAIVRAAYRVRNRAASAL